MSANKKSADKGFTFLEAMMAIFVFTVGLVAVLSSFIIAFNTENNSQRQSQAVFLAQEKIEETIYKAYTDIAVGAFIENSLASPFEKFKRETRITYLDANLAESAVDEGLKKITVQVSWPKLLNIAQNNLEFFSIISRK